MDYQQLAGALHDPFWRDPNLGHGHKIRATNSYPSSTLASSGQQALCDITNGQRQYSSAGEIIPQQVLPPSTLKRKAGAQGQRVNRGTHGDKKLTIGKDYGKPLSRAPEFGMLDFAAGARYIPFEMVHHDDYPYLGRRYGLQDAEEAWMRARVASQGESGNAMLPAAGNLHVDQQEGYNAMLPVGDSIHGDQQEGDNAMPPAGGNLHVDQQEGYNAMLPVGDSIHGDQQEGDNAMPPAGGNLHVDQQEGYNAMLPVGDSIHGDQQQGDNAMPPAGGNWHGYQQDHTGALDNYVDIFGGMDDPLGGFQGYPDLFTMSGPDNDMFAGANDLYGGLQGYQNPCVSCGYSNDMFGGGSSFTNGRQGFRNANGDQSQLNALPMASTTTLTACFKPENDLQEKLDKNQG